jgi:hypothetical protein
MPHEFEFDEMDRLRAVGGLIDKGRITAARDDAGEVVRRDGEVAWKAVEEGCWLSANEIEANRALHAVECAEYERLVWCHAGRALN